MLRGSQNSQLICFMKNAEFSQNRKCANFAKKNVIIVRKMHEKFAQIARERKFARKSVQTISRIAREKLTRNYGEISADITKIPNIWCGRCEFFSTTKEILNFRII